jgi:hypothetical protein
MVLQQDTNISKDLAASIFRVKFLKMEAARSTKY